MKIPRAAAFLWLCLVPAAAGLAGQVKLPNDIAWVELSDAYKACCLQAYNTAGGRLRELAKAEKPGSWCVVLDADETIISNVEFEKELVVKGIEHTSEGWDAWCAKGRATALPGAKEFCALARELGGKVVLITNREGPNRAGTIRNLGDLGFAYDAVLFRDGPYAKDRRKTARRGDVEKGTVKGLPEGTALPPLKILMLAGDQMHDLYDAESLSLDKVKDRFGRDLVIIPNPMYGDWSKGAYVRTAEAAPAGGAAPSPGALAPGQAAKMEGREVVVEGTVASVRARERGPDSLYFEGQGKRGLSVALFGQGKPADSKAKFEGKRVRVKGKVTEYRGAPQIKVSDPSGIELLP